MKTNLERRNLLILITLLLCNNFFAQDLENVRDRLQGTWEMCAQSKMYTRAFVCEIKPLKDCAYQIEIRGKKFILYNKNSEKIDLGEFEIENTYDKEILTIQFYSSLSDEIFEILDTNTIFLFIDKKDEPSLYMPHKYHQSERSYILKKK